MNTPKTDAIAKEFSSGDVNASDILYFARQLETRVQELREALSESVELADAYSGISRNNFENLLAEFSDKARAILEKTK